MFTGMVTKETTSMAHSVPLFNSSFIYLTAAKDDFEIEHKTTCKAPKWVMCCIWFRKSETKALLNREGALVKFPFVDMDLSL